MWLNDRGSVPSGGEGSSVLRSERLLAQPVPYPDVSEGIFPERSQG
jgi:hypothetical protein